jgi:hypothetical protein
MICIDPLLDFLISLIFIIELNRLISFNVCLLRDFLRVGLEGLGLFIRWILTELAMLGWSILGLFMKRGLGSSLLKSSLILVLSYFIDHLRFQTSILFINILATQIKPKQIYYV